MNSGIMFHFQRDRCIGAMLRNLALGVLFTLSATSARPQGALAYDLMIDASGSMKGFSQGDKAAWNAMLSALESKADRRWSFGSRVTSVQTSLTDVALDQRMTRLGKCFMK